MKLLMIWLIWCTLLVLCWPIALLALLAWPLIWLLWLPFRILKMTLEGVLALLQAILFLPARLLGYRGHGA
ncbi:MAG: hypothetical protein P8L18_10565 [Verrucomicrobiota bacterium]|nr:hypothetical protein [Verrucomicrobiota bacterium]